MSGGRLYRAGRLLALVWLLVMASTAIGAEGTAESPRIAEIELVSVGDIIMHLPIVESCRDASGNYNFRSVFAAIAPELQKADLATAVLETVLAGKAAGGFTGYPSFNSPDEIAEALQWAGVDLVFTAHNHILDRGAGGVLRMVDTLDSIGLPNVGANSGPDPAKRMRILEVKGIRLAFLSYTTITNGIPTPADRPWLINRFETAQAIQDIARAKTAGADFIIAALHAGTEYRRIPDDSQLAAAYFLLGHGVDVILGSHPHVVEPAEYISQQQPAGNFKTKFVIYSMGNCLSNQRWRYSDYGVLVRMNLRKTWDEKGTVLTGVTTQPIWVHKFISGGRTGYRVLPVNPGGVTGEDPLLTVADRAHLQQVWDDAQETVGTIPVITPPIPQDEIKAF